MSLHITVWEVSVISPTMGDRVVLRARWGVGEGGWPRAGVGGWRGVRAEAGLGGKHDSPEPVWGAKNTGSESLLSSAVLLPPFNVFFEKHREEENLV